jgi:hypothetical protein
MAFTDLLVQLVWLKASAVPGYDASKFRKDACGAWMARDQYGNRDSQYGWEIDHIRPVSLGGNDSILNLRPLQWRNNCYKSNGVLTCPITAAI